jgi:hypothetical protein
METSAIAMKTGNPTEIREAIALCMRTIGWLAGTSGTVGGVDGPPMLSVLHLIAALLDLDRVNSVANSQKQVAPEAPSEETGIPKNSFGLQVEHLKSAEWNVSRAQTTMQKIGTGKSSVSLARDKTLDSSKNAAFRAEFLRIARDIEGLLDNLKRLIAARQGEE